MRKPALIALFLINVFCVLSNIKDTIIWYETKELSYPDQNTAHPGLAGAFSGFVGDDYVIAGGANFPGQKPWSGGEKKWYKDIYISNDIVLSDFSKVGLNLPQELAYGVSVSIPDGLLCIGGSDAITCSDRVFLIRSKSDTYEIDSSWPTLPYPLSNATGQVWNNKVIIAGGQTSVESASSTCTFLMLDLDQRKREWKELQAWPGRSRAYAVSAIQSNGSDPCFYLFSGRSFTPDSVQVLYDGFEYNLRLNKWTKLTGYFPVMAGTALSTGSSHILFLGGVELLLPANDDHPGFSNKVYGYHTITKTFEHLFTSPCALPVTTHLTKHNNKFYIGSGETRPGERTPKVIAGEIVGFERSLGWLNIMVIILYFLSLSIIGVYFARKQKNTDDYFKGGGRLPWWAVGLSIFGTTLSAITFMAIPAKSFSADWSYILMNAGIILVLPVIIYLFIPFYRALEVTTAYEYLEKRFNSKIRVISSLAFILFQIGRMGIVLFLPSIALNVVTGFDILLCIMVMGILSLVYTMIGGIEAVVWTDALQVVVLLGGAIMVVVLISLDTPGGFIGIIQEASALNKFCIGSFNWDIRQSTIITVLVASFFSNLTTYGTDQTLVQRYMTTATQKEAVKSVLTNGVMTVPATILFFFVGTALFIYYKNMPESLSVTIADGDAILPWYIFTELPQGVAGLLISGIFAAAMSTLSSSMNSAATAYVTDVHKKICKREVTSEKLLTIAKISTCLLGLSGILFAMMMATWEVKSMWDEFNKILGIILGSLGGLFMLGMVTVRANGKGALAGLLASLILQLIIVQAGVVHLLLYAATGFLSCFVFGYIFSIPFKHEREDYIQYTIYKTKK